MITEIENDPDESSANEIITRNTLSVTSQKNYAEQTKPENQNINAEKSSSDTDPKSETISSISNKVADENTSISANTSDTSSKDNVIDDDDDIVIDEILKYKIAASQER